MGGNYLKMLPGEGAYNLTFLNNIELGFAIHNFGGPIKIFELAKSLFNPPMP